MELQPCDWHERDVKKKYVVDVYGRLESGETALVRVTGFRPFFYVGGSASVAGGVRVSKYDVMAGFTGKGKIPVWKVMCESLSEFHEKSRTLAEEGRTLYESNLPPFLRLIHTQHLGPGSPFTFTGTPVPIPEKDDEPEYAIDNMFTCTYSTLAPSDVSIPLKVASYDLEMYSESGRFPTARGGDPIIQIGVSFRWSNDLMTPTSNLYGMQDRVGCLACVSELRD
jgi:DNA polymerase elongation subunit (family B)